MIKRFKWIAALAAIMSLTVVSAASAHVTLQPDSAAAGDYVVLDVRVPNEEDNAGTTKVDLQLPPGFAFASYQRVPGWSVDVKTEKLAEPVQTDDGPLTEGVTEMIWTADNAASAIAPGQFQDFPISVQIPDKPGESLTFKALQTYSNGEVVRWIGAPDSEHPAPQVAVTASTGDEHGSMSHDEAAAEPSADGDGGSDSSNGLAIAALIVGALGLVAGGAAFARTRKA